jgi:hypothetical protein
VAAWPSSRDTLLPLLPCPLPARCVAAAGQSQRSRLSVAGGSPPLGYSAGRVGTPARPSQPPRKCLLSRCHSGCSSLSHLPREPPGPLSPSLARALTVRWRRRRQRVAERLRLVGVGVVVEGAAQVRRLRRARLRYLLLLALAAALHLLACFGVPCTPSHTHTHTRRLSMCRLPSRAKTSTHAKTNAPSIEGIC